MDIKKLRTERSLTQVQLARFVGVSSQTVRMWEWQDVAPNEENMKKLEELRSGQRSKQMD